MSLPGLAVTILVGPFLVGCIGGGSNTTDGAPSPTSDVRPHFPSDATLGTTRVFAHVGAPGNPEGIAVVDGQVLVSVSENEDPTGALLVYSLATGALLDRIVMAKEPGDATDLSRFLGVAVDGRGSVFVTDTGVGRILKIDRSTNPPRQSVYASIPNLPPCLGSLPGSPCSPTTTDTPALPNYPIFGPSGELYVSDLFQATIFRVPAGGGDAQPWFQDVRLGNYGANGLALSPGDTHLYIGQSTFALAVGAEAPAGAIYRIPLTSAPSGTDLELIHQYPDQAVDGIAFGASGRLYVALVGLVNAPHGISVLAPDGREVAFFPNAGASAKTTYFFPASIAFDDERRSILVTNQAFGQPDQWAVLDAFVDDMALPLHKP